MDVNIRISKQVFNPVYLPYLDNWDRYLVFYGGGSSGKSYFIAQLLVYRLLHPYRFNVLVCRQDKHRTVLYGTCAECNK